MSRQYNEELDKIARQETARMAKGEKKCPNCGNLYLPNENSGATCDECWERAISKG